MNQVNQIKINNIKSKLRDALQTTHVEITDESHQHVHHSSYDPEKMHLALSIKSNVFNDLSMLEKQRMIYKVLNEEMNTTIHALRFEKLDR